MIIQIKNDEQFNEILKGDKPVIADFYADWCGPCKMLSPIIDEIANEKSEQLEICKINVDENQELAQKYSVKSIPTVISFKNGDLYKKSVGLVPKEEILKVLD